MYVIYSILYVLLIVKKKKIKVYNLNTIKTKHKNERTFFFAHCYFTSTFNYAD